MAHAFGIREANRNITLDLPPLSYEDACLKVRGIQHYQNTDYHVIETSFECSAECAATHPGRPRP